MPTSTRVKSPPRPPRTRYEDDLYTWVEEQVALLRAGKLGEIDAANIAEELGDVGKEQLSKLESSIAVLTMHLLKWDHQSKARSRGWMATVNEQRKRINRVLRDNPSLERKVQPAITDAYPLGRDRAVAETNQPYQTFPESCPYSFDEMMTRPIEYEEPPKRRKRRTNR